MTPSEIDSPQTEVSTQCSKKLKTTKYKFHASEALLDIKRR